MHGAVFAALHPKDPAGKENSGGAFQYYPYTQPRSAMRLLLLLPLLLAACVTSRERPVADTMTGEWTLVAMEADRGLSALPATHPVSLRLSQGISGNLTGRAFVNQYSGTLAIDADGRVTERPILVATRMGGPASLMDLEMEYFRRWEEAERVEERGAQLVVLDDEGDVILRFERNV